MRALLVILMISGDMSAQTPPPNATAGSGKPQTADQEVPPEDKCTIEGNVASALTGEPLKKAHVRLRYMEGSGNNYGALTDAAGHYVIDQINPGRYNLSADRNGYVSADYGQRSASASGALLTLGTGQRLKDLNIRLQAQAVVSGRVMDEDNEPMSAVSVTLLRQTYRSGKRTLQRLNGGMTDDRGEYRVYNVSPGRYYALAVPNAARFQQGPVITKDTQGSYAPVYYPNSIGEPAGASQIAAAAGAETQGIDFRLTRIHTVHLSGKVTNAPSGSFRTMVLLQHRDAGDVVTQDTTIRQRTDGQGRFRFQDVMPGAYTLTAVFPAGDTPMVATTAVDVAEKNIDGLMLSFANLPDISGTVRADGLELKGLGLRVQLQPVTQQMMFRAMRGEVADDGGFRLTSVAPNRYRVIVSPLPSGTYVQSVSVGPADAPDGIVDFSRGAAGDLTVMLSPKAGEIDGHVQQKDAPAGGAMVVLVPDQRDLYRDYKSALTDQTGAFSIKGIRPGGYKLFAWDHIENDAWTDPDYLQQFENDGDAVAVRESDKLKRDLKLIVTSENATQAVPAQ